MIAGHPSQTRHDRLIGPLDETKSEMCVRLVAVLSRHEVEVVSRRDSSEQSIDCGRQGCTK